MSLNLSPSLKNMTVEEWLRKNKLQRYLPHFEDHETELQDLILLEEVEFYKYFREQLTIRTADHIRKLYYSLRAMVDDEEYAKITTLRRLSVHYHDGKFVSDEEEALIVGLENEYKFICQVHETLNESMKKLEKNKKTSTLKLHDKFDELMDLLHEEERLLLMQINYVERGKKKRLKEQMKDIEKYKDHFRKELENVNDVVNDLSLSPHHRKLQIKTHVSRALKKYKNDKLKTTPCVSSDVILEWHQEVAKELGARLGTILKNKRPQPPELSVTTTTWSSVHLEWTMEEDEDSKDDGTPEFIVEYRRTDSKSQKDWRVTDVLVDVDSYVIQDLKSNVSYDIQMKGRTGNTTEHMWSLYSTICRVQTEKPPVTSRILKEKELNDLLEILSVELRKKHPKLRLLFRASRDSFDSTVFHDKCDDEGATVSIIQSANNHVFGGYTSVSWTSPRSGSSYKKDTKSFLFLLRANESILDKYHVTVPSTFHITPIDAYYAVCHDADFGPTFGCEYDIFVANHCDTNMKSRSNFPVSYHQYHKRNKSRLLAGSKQFKVLDYEVFRV